MTPPIANRHPARDWIDLAILVVVWGSSFALTKIAVTEMAPMWVVAWRLTLGAVILTAVLWLRGEALPQTRRDWFDCGWIAVVGNIAPFWLISWGTQHISSGLAGVLMAAVPLVVIVMAAIFLTDEPLTPRKMLGFVAGFSGVVLLIGPNALFSFRLDDLHLIGALAVLTATLGYATQAVAVRLMRPMSGLQRGTGMLIVASVLAMPLAAISEPHGFRVEQIETIAAVVALGVFPTALASIILFPLLVSAGAGFTALSNYLVPVFALMVGVIGLGETFASDDLAGLALILSGIAIARARRQTARP